MLKYSLLSGSVSVSIDSDDLNSNAPILVESDLLPAVVDSIRQTLAAQHGAFGHLIGERTSPIDLSIALKSPAMQRYVPVLVEGAELVQSFDPGIPEGAIT